MNQMNQLHAISGSCGQNRGVAQDSEVERIERMGKSELRYRCGRYEIGRLCDRLRRGDGLRVFLYRLKGELAADRESDRVQYVYL